MGKQHCCNRQPTVIRGGWRLFVMTLRSSLLAVGFAATLLAPMPAMAREKGISEAVAKLNDPRTQSMIAGTMATMMQALMNMKAAPFVQMMDGMEGAMERATGEKTDERQSARNIDPDATLGDLAGADARAMPQEMAEKVPAMMGAMAGMAGSMEAILPELEAMAKQLKKSLPLR
jgi:hypothetical protein